MARTSTRPRHGSPHQLTPAFDLFGKSAAIVRQHIWIFGTLNIIPFIFAFRTWLWAPAGPNATGQQWWQHVHSAGPGWAFGPLPTFTNFAFVGFSILWFLIVIFVGTAVQVMNQEAQLEGAEGKAVITFSKLWEVVKEMWLRMLGLYILVGIFIVVGLVLFVVPGIIMIRRYFLAPYVMLDKKPKSIMEAMDISARISKPYSGSIWRIIGVMILIGFVNVVPFLGWIASFILGMFYSVAPALRYQELKKLS